MIRRYMTRFMTGRYGGDQLNLLLAALYVIFYLIYVFTRIIAFELLALILIVVSLYRSLSRSIDRRRAENARFLAWWQPRRAGLAAARALRLDRELRYFTCKTCGTVCRVPAGKGRIELTCPRCGGTRRVKS